MVDGDTEIGRDAHRELKARIIVAAFEIADRLRVNPDSIRQGATRCPTLGAKHSDAIVNIHSYVV